MRKFETPQLVISKCIEFESCRYNGLKISSQIVKDLKKNANFYPVCPEVGIGLGIPRDPIRLVKIDDEINLIQPSTQRNLTKKMKQFSDSFLNDLNNIDGFILKNKSPSCGIKAVRVYPQTMNSRPYNDGIGLFSVSVFEKFPFIPVEDEGRLRNLKIRENFLTSIYTLAEYRKIKKSEKLIDLIDFHSRNKYLLLSYNQILSQKMGRLIGDQKSYSSDDLFQTYGDLLSKTLKTPPEAPANINMLMHVLGHFSGKLTHEEKSFFLDAMEKYRQGVMPLLVCLNILKAWVIRFNEDYLKDQTFFQPYPEKLMPVTNIQLV
ncbi:YbgA family protein [Methanobacterium alcaliphilum]|uniref:YbgA family protein n=1 Tax=Methanobacterium alcaliphilum TaxID=392018 RepID=UPI00200A833F|nr:DUF523 and DUF1722 domain-containing protein [Methanobacterium alcaliphilum]MCK9150959.1 DUF523 and DUF1722 domain-containing protein [Methanobacterium alcaliphilum]